MLNHQATGTTHRSTNAEAGGNIGQFLFPEWSINFALNEDMEVISRENSLRKLEMCTEFNWNKATLFFPTFHRIVLRLKTNKISKLSKKYI